MEPVVPWSRANTYLAAMDSPFAGAGREPGGGTGATADVEDTVVGTETRQIGDETGVGCTPDGHGQPGDIAEHAGELAVVGVVVGREVAHGGDATHSSAVPA